MTEIYSEGLEIKDDEVVSNALSAYAWCMFLKGDFSEAASYAFSALDYCPEDKVLLEANIKNIIGITYSELGEYNEAARMLQEALDIYRKEDKEQLEYMTCVNLSAAYGAAGQMSKAREYGKFALKMSRKYKDRVNEGRILNNLYYTANDPLEGIAYLDSAIAIASEIDDLHLLAECYSNKGDASYKLNKFEDAERFLEESNDYASKVNAQNIIANSLLTKVKIFKSKGEYGMAITAFERYFDELSRQKKEDALKNVHNLALNERMMKLRNENVMRTLEADRMRTNTIILIVTIIVVAGFLVVAIVYHKYRQRRDEVRLMKVSKDLDEKIYELEYLRLFLSSRIGLLDKIREMIKETYKVEDCPSTVTAQLKKIIVFISQFDVKEVKNSMLDADTQQFQQRLKEQYPAITKTLSTLAVYIRAGLQNKTISLLTGQQLKTLEMSRSRLRKVLEVDGTVDLKSFLRQI
ncbi:MAG: tetratricopeptide repeat protein [Muribaculaceae bacterium]|nr:tetratricopeptide repeat protein [Muribaculaceae bacterium]